MQKCNLFSALGNNVKWTRCVTMNLYSDGHASYNVGMPTVKKIGRLRFFFFSNEAKEPAHIHVESGHKYAKFWLEPVQLVKSIGYNAKELSQIRKLIVSNSSEFKRRWNEYFGI